MLSSEKCSSLPNAGRSSSMPAIRGGGESPTGQLEASTGTGATRRSESSDSCSRSASRTGHVQRTMSTSSPSGDSLISMAMASASTASSKRHLESGEVCRASRVPASSASQLRTNARLFQMAGASVTSAAKAARRSAVSCHWAFFRGAIAASNFARQGTSGGQGSIAGSLFSSIGNLGGTIDVNQPLHGLAVFRVQRGQQMQQGPAGRPTPFLDQQLATTAAAS